MHDGNQRITWLGLLKVAVILDYLRLKRLLLAFSIQNSLCSRFLSTEKVAV